MSHDPGLKGIIRNARQAPPQDLEAEQVVLGSVLIGKASPDVIPNPDFFYRDAHKEIAKAILEIRNSDSEKETDLVTVTGWLNNKNKLDQVGGPAYLASLTDIAYFNPGHVEIIVEKAILRKVVSSLSDVAMKAYNEQHDVDAILAEMQRETNEILSMSASKSAENMDIGLDDLMGSFLAKETHLSCLNEAVGGLPIGVTVIGGQTSMGKTSLALGLLKKIAIDDEMPVAYFSRFSIPQIYFRLLASMCKIDNNVLKRGNVNKEQRVLLSESRNTINGSFSPYTLDKKTSVMDVICKSRALAKDNPEGLGGIIVENLQELTWPEKTRSRKEELDIIVKALDDLSLDLAAPVVLSSQVNRDISDREDKRARPTDMLGTSDIESLARMILIPYWDEYYSKKESQHEDGSFEAEIAVHKSGSPTTLKLRFNPMWMSWYDA